MGSRDRAKECQGEDCRTVEVFVVETRDFTANNEVTIPLSCMLRCSYAVNQLKTIYFCAVSLQNVCQFNQLGNSISALLPVVGVIVQQCLAAVPCTRGVM